MRAFLGFMKKYVPRWALISVACAALSVIALLLASVSAPFADFLNGTIGEAVRISLAVSSSVLPLSLFEWLLILLIPLTVLFIILRVRRGGGGHPLRTVFSLIGIIGIIASSYVFTLGVGYHTTPLADRLSIKEDKDITKEELYAVAEHLVGEINSLADGLSFSQSESVMGYSIDDLSRELASAYGEFLNKYPIFTGYTSRVKPVMASVVMSDAGITGIYSFFTGEANLNVDYPDYTHPFTAAHELAHQRGIARENEANFIAFLVCTASSDPYIRYSGYLNMFEYVGSALYRTDRDSYRELLARLDKGAVADMRASSAVTAAHKDSWFNKLNDFLNDTYLKANGTEGVVSYGYVVRLAVGYYSYL